MSRYDRLAFDDARCVLRLVGELREIGAPPEAWAPHLFSEVDRQIGAPVANRFESGSPFDREPALSGLIPFGFDNTGRKVWQRYWETRGTDRDPSWLPAVEMSRASFTCARSRVVSDREWYGSAHVSDERRVASIDHFVITHRVLEYADWGHTILFYREWGDRPFSMREMQWIELLHEELARLWTPPRLLITMGPRLSETLAGLLAGESEKTLAQRMDLSVHTVHEYVKALHRHFGVRSRGELMAACARDPMLHRPRLSAEISGDPRWRASVHT